MNLLPRGLAATGDAGAPVAATVAAAACSLAFLFLPFGGNLGVQSVMYGACSAVLALAAIDMEPPYKFLPASRASRAALMFPALVAAAVTVATQSGSVLAGTGCAMVSVAALVQTFPPAREEHKQKTHHPTPPVTL